MANHEKQAKKDEFKRMMQDLLRKPDHDRYANAMKKLAAKGVDTPEVYAQKKAVGGGGAPSAPSAPGGQVTTAVAPTAASGQAASAAPPAQSAVPGGQPAQTASKPY